jgi:hypothetical protein
MTNVRLIACASCARHVRVSESSCPFCAHPLPAELRAAAPPRPPPRRLGRNALYVFGLASVALTGACGEEVFTTVDAAYGGPPVEDAQPEDVGFGGVLYGAPAVDAGEGFDTGVFSDATEDADVSEAGRDGTTIDASQDALDAGSPSDATTLDHVTIAPVYGAPPYGAPPHP